MTPNRRLKQERELRGWSQAKVAEQIGTDATTVSRWERGLFSPTPYFRERLCTLFNKNAAELGLLDAEYHSEEYEPRLLAPHAPSPLPFQQDTDALHKSGTQTSTIAPPAAPSWPRRGDTFGYILDSAAHDQQAHILWEDAYVRVMRGQRAEAQILGEASLNAFEHVGHPNAEALREWLKKNELLPESSEPPHPSAPLPLLTKPPKKTVRQMFRRRNIGLAILLLALATIGLSGYAFSHAFAPNVQAGVQSSSIVPAPTPTPAQNAAQPAVVTATATSVSTQTASSPTSVVQTPRPAHAAPRLTLSIAPASLTPQQCMPDSGYRCTLYLTLYCSKQDTLYWQGSSPDLMVKFGTPGGESHSGGIVQVIVYIQSAPGQHGQLIFTLKSSTSSTREVVSWQG